MLWVPCIRLEAAIFPPMLVFHIALACSRPKFGKNLKTIIDILYVQGFVFYNNNTESPVASNLIHAVCLQGHPNAFIFVSFRRPHSERSEIDVHCTRRGLDQRCQKPNTFIVLTGALPWRTGQFTKVVRTYPRAGLVLACSRWQVARGRNGWVWRGKHLKPASRFAAHMARYDACLLACLVLRNRAVQRG